MEIEELEVSESTAAVDTGPSQVRRTPADLLLERQACLRRITHEIPSVEELMKHAERFGTDQVVETATELGYGLETCVRLTEHCDRLDALAYKESHRFGSLKRTKSAEARCKALLGITDDEDEDKV